MPKKKLKRFLAAGLLASFCLTSILSPAAGAAETKKEAAKADDTNKTKMVRVTENFVNGSGGKKLAETKTYNDDNDRDVREEKIPGYTFKTYEKEITNVYLTKDIPYIVGYPDKTVRPLRFISRAEAAAVFHRLYDGDYPKEVNTWSKDTFKDVPENAWYIEPVKQMYKSGIIAGSEGKFRPDEPITRAELAGLATRFNPEKFGGKKDDGAFADVSTGQWYSSAVALAAANKWVSGYPDGTFKPNNYITRTETMSIINRVLDRQMTTEKLRELGVKNPYTDIKEDDWYYADALEATINHKKERGKWHGFDYNGGKYNVIIEKYVDTEGNVIRKKKVSDGKEVKSPKDIVGFNYVGYVKVLTYVYEKGTPVPSVSKTSEAEGKDGKAFFPGDEVTYTIKVQNDKKATSPIENAKIYDPIPKFMTFVDGSVTVNGKSHDYEMTDYMVSEKGNFVLAEAVKTGQKQLEISLGDVKAGEGKTIQFKAKIDKDAFNKEVKNIAVLTGDNIVDLKSANQLDPKLGTDDKDPKNDPNKPLPKRNDSIPPGIETGDKGFVVQEGKAYLNMDKVVDKKEAEVGDTIKYTIKVDADKTSKTRAKNVVVTDTIPMGLEFKPGTLQVDGKFFGDIEYNADSRELKVPVGDIEVEKSKTITFDAQVTKDAFDMELKNVATGKGTNTDPKKSKDDTAITKVKDGKAYLDISKEVNKKEAKVGDTLTYTVKVKTDGKSKNDAKGVVVTDPIDPALDFAGSVTVDGKGHSDFSYDEEARLLTVNLGDVKIDQTKKVVFKVTVNKTGYGKEVENIASAEGTNAERVSSGSKVSKIDEGKANLSIQKTADKTEAKVGDNLDYTITVANDANAEVAANNVKVTDPIPQGLEWGGIATIAKTDAQGKSEPGVSAKYVYNMKTGVIEVLVGSLLPGEKAEIVLRTVVKDTAQGKTIYNKATGTADNANPKEAEVNRPTVVEKGKADGRVGAKSVNKSQAKVGDTLSYEIEVANSSSATADWENVTITDPIPEELEYVGHLEKNGKGSNDGSFDSKTNTLTLKPEALKPGEKAVYKFDVKVKEAAEGKTIVNVAVLKTPGEPDRNLPSTPVVVPEGKAGPYVLKTHDQDKVGDLEYLTYTVEVGNRSKNATWKNVTLVDTLPSEVQLIGQPTLQGKTDGEGLAMVGGSTVTQPIGDIAPGESVKVTYTVQVKKGTAKEVSYKKGASESELDKLRKQNAVTLINTANATGENGTGGATDDKVKVPPVLVPEEGGSGVPGKPDRPDDQPTLEKTAETERIDLSTRDGARNTYTIKLTNDTDKVWKDIKVTDVLDTSRLTFYRDSLTINGVPKAWGTDFSYKPNGSSMLDTLTIPVGDIQPGKAAIIQFKVLHANDGADKPYVNQATAESKSHDPVTGDVTVSFNNPQPVSKIHHVLSAGYTDGTWGPYATTDKNFLSTEEAAAFIARSITAEKRQELMQGRDYASNTLTLNNAWASNPVRFMVGIGALKQYELLPTPPLEETKDYVQFGTENAQFRFVATRNQIGRMLKACGLTGLPGYDYSTDRTGTRLHRLDFIKELEQITGRDTQPNTNGLPTRTFSDTRDPAVTESAVWHNYVLDNQDREVWIATDLNKTVSI
ncbi:isopeptide-forming domain-containing fimbrial protein [Peptococcus simiae]|uniref:isopeptide-forming domain-containing fimbrial protein n=3 Tax=Peptococcus simiae TaxID=1643805 RepID=UPI00397EABB0